VTRKVLLAFCIGSLAFVPNLADGQARDTSRVRASTATLSGIVKDEYGDPLPNAEIRAQPGEYGARSDTMGMFRIEAPAGEYNVVFRRLGYGASDFSWRARPGEGTELSVRLDPLPQSLDTVVVRDSHDRVAGASVISGTVLDSRLQPLKDVELQLVGTGHRAISYETGQFFFSGLAQGSYVLRARRLGFSPNSLTVTVGKGEEHEIAMKLTALGQTLTTVEIREKSGYGAAAIPWEEFDRRQRWHSSTRSVTVTRYDFGRLGKMPLDWALRYTPAATLIDPRFASGGGHAPTSIRPENSGGLALPGLAPVAGDVCMLINGLKADRRPLSWFKADEVERVEVIASNSDMTGTIGSRMGLVKGCQQEGFLHPPYFVVWLRGNQ
jgi:Carboxypeptidase regulatory-like domain